MEPIYIRGFADVTTIRATDGKPAVGPIRFTASTAGVARDGLIIDADGWDLDNFRSNPVFLWAHDYMGRNLPIGKVVEIGVKDGNLVADVEFDQSDEFARQVEAKYRNGFLNAVSVGWDTKQIEPASGAGGAPKVTRAELLEISGVPVPSDPKALAARQKRAIAEMGKDIVDAFGIDELREIFEEDQSRIKRGAIAPHTTDKAPEDAAWDAAAVLRAVEGAAKLRSIHAWVNPEGDPEAKASYKLPHHDAEGKVVWRGVAAAMSRLLQPGTNIPDSDRRAVFNHLARHYKQFDKTAPEFRSAEELFAYDSEQIRGLFFEGEAEMFPVEFIHGDERAGKAIATRNRERLEQAVSLIQDVLSSSGKAKKEEEEQPEETEEERSIREQQEALAKIANAFGLGENGND